MKSIADPLPGDEQARCLIVFLPGVADRAYTFKNEGFVDELRKRDLKVDVVSADSTVGYYLRGTQSQRLDWDVVAPAEKKPYQQVWVVGVSMGGWGTLHYAATHPGRVDGVVALAPHLGEKSNLWGISRAGGLAKWQPPVPDHTSPQNYTIETWRWLRGVTVEHKPGPQIYVGYADNDFVTGHAELLVDALPKDHVMHVGGLHSWGSWRKMWSMFLDQSDFSQRCGGPPAPTPMPAPDTTASR